MKIIYNTYQSQVLLLETYMVRGFDLAFEQGLIADEARCRLR